MLKYLVAAALLAALVLPGLSAAKGPSGASISGPGLARSLAITGNGEGPGTLGTLAASGGFFAQMFGQAPDPTLRTRPRGTLGPRYVAVYVVPGPNSVQSRVTQSIYPYAKPVALTYMKPGQSFWDDKQTRGGWFRASAGLKRVLVRLGLPAIAPS
jgi:hypothetical protein